MCAWRSLPCKRPWEECRLADGRDRTGASAGIGAAVARQFVASGAKVIVTARRLERLDNLKAELEEKFPGSASRSATPQLHLLPIAFVSVSLAIKLSLSPFLSLSLSLCLRRFLSVSLSLSLSLFSLPLSSVLACVGC